MFKNQYNADIDGSPLIAVQLIHIFNLLKRLLKISGAILSKVLIKFYVGKVAYHSQRSESFAPKPLGKFWLLAKIRPFGDHFS